MEMRPVFFQEIPCFDFLEQMDVSLPFRDG